MTAGDRSTRATAADVGLGLLAAAVVARLWAMPLGSSLWLDEFGTWWVSDGGLAGVLDRARLFPQSVPYGWLIAVVRSAFGASEAVLRLPSILAMLAAVVALIGLGRTLFDRTTAYCAAAALLVFPQIEFAAGDARPYALAVLLVVLSTLGLVRWLDRGRLRDGLLYLLAAAAAVYLQYLFAAALLAHAAYAWRRRGRTAVSRPAAVGAAAALAVLLAPAAALVVEIRASAASHAYAELPGLGDLGHGLVPVRGVALVLGGAIVAFAVRVARRLRPGGPDDRTRDAWVLLAAGAAAPPLVLFVASRLTGIAVFEGRYLLAAVPFWSLILGRGLAAIEPAAGRRVAVGAALALTLGIRGELGRREIAHGREAWRAAVAASNAANGEAPVFLAGTFAESADPLLAADPSHAGYLLSPLTYYGARGPAAVLPLRPASGDLGGRAEALFAGASAPARFAVVERRSRRPSWIPKLEELLRPRGYESRRVWASQTLMVVEFAATER